MLGISIIMCCFNGEERLSETIKYIDRQHTSDATKWEFIFVDSASTDNTFEFARKEISQYPGLASRSMVKRQHVPGKQNAIEVGITLAKYEFILICDDDNWLFPDYVEKSYKLISVDKNIGVVGGCGIFSPQQPVSHVAERYQTSYINGPQYWAEKDHWVYGAGSIYRKSAYLIAMKLSWQQTLSVSLKSSQISAEDVETCFVIYLMGYKIVFDETLQFYHFVPLSRQTKRYIQNLQYRQSYCYILLTGYIMLINNDTDDIKNKLNTWLIQNLKGSIVNSISWFLKKLTLKKNLNEDYFKIIRSIGVIHSIIENREGLVKHYKISLEKNELFRRVRLR